MDTLYIDWNQKQQLEGYPSRIWKKEGDGKKGPGRKSGKKYKEGNGKAPWGIVAYI